MDKDSLTLISKRCFEFRNSTSWAVIIVSMCSKFTTIARSRPKIIDDTFFRKKKKNLSNLAYKLRQPTDYKVHSVFHVTLLKKNKTPSRNGYQLTFTCTRWLCIFSFDSCPDIGNQSSCSSCWSFEENPLPMGHSTEKSRFGKLGWFCSQISIFRSYVEM